MRLYKSTFNGLYVVTPDAFCGKSFCGFGTNANTKPNTDTDTGYLLTNSGDRLTTNTGDRLVRSV